MKFTSKLILGLILVAFGLGLLHFALSKSQEANLAASPDAYRNDLGVSFTVPEGLYLQEVSRPGEVPPLSVVLVEDTRGNRDVLDGKSETAREGPPSITVDVYENPEGLPAQDWLQRDTNWTVANSSSTAVAVAGVEGVTFSWSGLYEGKSVVLATDSRAYVIAVSWLPPDDHLVEHFEEVLDSIAVE
jgi:hypothetical protein